MNLEELKPKEGSVKKRTRVGRGNASGHGGECGRGHKGQKSRSGYSRQAGFEGGQMPLYRRLPKKPGFRNPFRKEYQVINLSQLDAKVKENDTVDLDYFAQHFGLSALGLIKVLGDGEMSKKVTIKAHKFSKTAKEKLENAGAVCELID